MDPFIAMAAEALAKQARKPAGSPGGTGGEFASSGGGSGKQAHPYHSEKSSRIRAEYDSYRKMPKAELKAIYQRHHRVSDVREADKQSLITGILSAKYGQSSVTAAYDKPLRRPSGP
jgi:hypothetical protein